jgi:hypothetical protein
MQYILLIHGNTSSPPSASEWTTFIERAQASGMFRGGSEIGARQVLGKTSGVASTAHIDGYMRFDSEDKQKIIDLLASHPVVVHGGSVELCEMPES